MRARNIKPGDRIGKLTVLQEVPKDKTSKILSHKRSRRFKFKCDCGGEIITMWGSAQSCGCLQIEIARHTALRLHRKKFGESAFNKVYIETLNGATRRLLEFRLTKEDFRQITQQDCFYCGKKPSMKVSFGKQHTHHGNYIHNGIDRKNNDLGYTVENSVACCTDCNLAKHTRSQQEFYDWIQKVHSHLTSKGFMAKSTLAILDHVGPTTTRFRDR